MIWSAFLLGFAGSLHCAGMCGPLMLALPGGENGPGSLAVRRLTHHAGRLTVYALMGLALGGVGESLALAGLQQWVSIAIGGGILIGAALAPSRLRQVPVAGFLQRINSVFSGLLRRDNGAARFLLGGLNGLLPCGLVYVAAAASVTTGTLLGGALYMAVFGLGTLPMLMAISLAGRRLAFRWAPAWRRAAPVLVAVVGILLAMRGMNLGIPGVSPRLSADSGIECACE